MRKSLMILTSALTLMFVQQNIWAADNDQKALMNEEMAESMDVDNKICPVSGEKIGSMGEGFKVVHEGKTYNLCCPGCEKQFKKDPEKYIEIINQELEKGEASEESHEGHDHSSHK